MMRALCTFIVASTRLNCLAISLFSVIALMCYTANWLVRGVPFAGFGTIVALVLLLFGVLTFMLGLIAEYIGLIYEEVKQRPNYLVKEVIGFSLTDD